MEFTQKQRDIVSIVLVLLCLACFAFEFFASMDDACSPNADLSGSDSVEQVVPAPPDLPVAKAAEPEPDEYGLTGQDLVATYGVRSFSIRPGIPAPKLDDEWLAGVMAAVAAIEESGCACSFTMVSLDDGTGYHYNPDLELYSASTAKAVFSYYILARSGDEEVDGCTRSNIESAIVNSDNGAYEALWTGVYYDEDYIAWLRSYGIEHDVNSYNGNYPDYSSSSLCAVWMDIAEYLGTCDDGEWLEELLGQTTVSFIRDGVGDAGTVLNKAGWIAEYGWDKSLDATNDAGIVEIGGRKYVMAIMTSQPCSPESEYRVGELACALLGIERAEEPAREAGE